MTTFSLFKEGKFEYDPIKMLKMFIVQARPLILQSKI